MNKTKKQQLLQLCKIWSDPVIQSIPVNLLPYPNGDQCKTKNFGNFTSLRTDKSCIDYRALTKTGLLANTDGLCNICKQSKIKYDNYASGSI